MKTNDKILYFSTRGHKWKLEGIERLNKDFNLLTTS